MISKQDVAAAAERISGHVRRTPVLRADSRQLGFDADLLLKLELMQHTGSFKPRGIFNRILSAHIPEAGVIAASGGNAGLAVAYAARKLHVPAEIFVPVTSPRVKVSRLESYGAKVVATGRFYADAYAASQERAAQTGALEVHAYDQPEVAAGQGTLAMELEQQLDRFDTALIAVGGGGLIAGIATWLEGTPVRVVAVEPESCPTLAAAIKSGQPTEVEVGGIAADSLGARQISAATLEIAQRTLMVNHLVTDQAIRQARQLLWDEFRIAAEPGGATALAALTSGSYQPAPGERVVAVICGGNADPCDLTGPSGP
jgi:threonine dehydratase